MQTNGNDSSTSISLNYVQSRLVVLALQYYHTELKATGQDCQPVHEAASQLQASLSNLLATVPPHTPASVALAIPLPASAWATIRKAVAAIHAAMAPKLERGGAEEMELVKLGAVLNPQMLN